MHKELAQKLPSIFDPKTISGILHHSVIEELFLDIGLMQHICGIDPFETINSSDLTSVYKGAIAEQFVNMVKLKKDLCSRPISMRNKLLVNLSSCPCIQLLNDGMTKWGL